MEQGYNGDEIASGNSQQRLSKPGAVKRINISEVYIPASGIINQEATDEIDHTDGELQVQEVGATETSRLLFREFFKVIKIHGGVLVAKCLSCYKELTVPEKVTSNLIRHLVKKHPEKGSEYKEKQQRLSKPRAVKRINISEVHLPASGIIDPLGTDEVDHTDGELQVQEVGATETSRLLFREFFKVIKIHGGVLVAKCLSCYKELTVPEKVTSNLIRHLVKKHPEKGSEYKEKQQRLSKPRAVKRINISDSSSAQGSQTKQLKISSPQVATSTQKKCDEALISYIVNSIRPFSTVEDQNFINYSKSLNPSYAVMSRVTLMKKIQARKADIEDNIKQQLAEADYVSTTADIWSTRHHSYMGISAHFVDNNLKRKSFLLACKQFESRRKERVAEIIMNVHDDFRLRAGKTLSTLTDNDSNMVKAFKDFGVPLDDVDQEYGAEREGDEEALDILQYILPKHQRYAAHTLNLIASADYMKMIMGSHLKGVHVRAFSKCTQIWNGSHRPKYSEAINKIISKNISYPNSTRWNSIQDCTLELIKIFSESQEAGSDLAQNNLNKLLEATSVASNSILPFTLAEINYLGAYTKLMDPIAKGFDYLQRDKQSFFGQLLPTLTTISQKLKNLKHDPALHTMGNIVEKLHESFHKRFEAQLHFEDSAKDSIIAAVSNPKYKLRWISNEVLREKAKTLFLQEVQKLQPALNEDTQIQIDDFLIFDLPKTNVDEAAVFLESSGIAYETLENFPLVKQVFKKFNTPLNSSGSIERIFSLAGVLDHARRGAISPANFELCMFIKGNQVYAAQ